MIHITAIDEAGNRSPEVSKQVSIMELTPPAPITDLSVGNISAAEIILYWTAVGDDGMEGTAESYIIKIDTEPVAGLKPKKINGPRIYL